MTLRVAVIGTGAFARAHIDILAQDPRVQVVSVSGSDLGRARAVAAGAPGAVASTEPMVELARADVDAVDVVNSNVDHARFAQAAARAGKHVLVDKPAALNLADFDAMTAAVAPGRTLMVGQTVRFQPAVAMLGAEIAAGRIGKARLVHISWYTGHSWSGGWRSWVLDPAKSGGHPVHNGSHIVDAATWLLGEKVRTVFARGFTTFAPGMGVPDSFQIIARTDSGALATLELSYALRVAGQMVRRVVVAGTSGTLMHSTENEPGFVPSGRPDAPVSIENALAIEMSHWVDVTGGAPPIVTNTQVRAGLAMALAAQRSLEQGRIVDVAEVES